MSDILLDVQHLTHCFPLPGRQTLRAVDDVSFQLKQGEILGLVGESGCGKSTVARCIMNVYRPTAGHIYYDGIDTCDAAQYRANRRRLEAERQLIFQDSTSSLNPRMTAAEIIAEPMAIHHMKPPRGSLRAEAAFQLYYVGMEESYLDKYPPELSGGQRQRVAIGRAIVRDPAVFLMDEPLSNLDAKLRVDMRAELKRLHHETGTTIIYVTHDQVEALTMSTRIALYRKGELVQVAPPLELYDNPVNLYTADFIGNPSINFVKGTAQVEAGGMRVDSPLGQLGFERGDMTEAAPQSGSVDVTIGVRPEQLSISRQADDAHWVEGHVHSGMPTGSETLVSVRVGDTMLTVKELGSTHYASDEPVYLGFNPKKVNVFETKSENLIKYCV